MLAATIQISLMLQCLLFRSVLVVGLELCSCGLQCAQASEPCRDSLPKGARRFGQGCVYETPGTSLVEEDPHHLLVLRSLTQQGVKSYLSFLPGVDFNIILFGIQLRLQIVFDLDS